MMTFVQISDEMCVEYQLHSAIGYIVTVKTNGRTLIQLPKLTPVDNIGYIVEILTSHVRVITDTQVIQDYTLKYLFGEF